MGRIYSGPFEFHKGLPPESGIPAGTLTCAVSKRVPRLYMEQGRETERSLRLL